MTPLFTCGYIAISSIVTFLHLMICVRRIEERVHLVFALMALCCALATLLNTQMHRVSDVDCLVRALKATDTVQVLLLFERSEFHSIS